MAGTQPDTVFRKLIEVLFDEQKAAWSPERSGDGRLEHSRKAKAAMYASSRSWQELGDAKMLPTGLPNIVDFGSGKYLMPLPPLEKDGHLVPWLSISYKLRKGAAFEDACCRIYVLLLGIDETGRFVGTGFRIESPERNCQEVDGSNGVGLHDFYHAQLIKRIETYGPQFITPEWLPCSQPSFPLWALNPIDALLSLFLTLYGARRYNDFLRKYAGRVGKIPMSQEFRQLNERLTRG